MLPSLNGRFRGVLAMERSRTRLPCSCSGCPFFLLQASNAETVRSSTHRDDRRVPASRYVTAESSDCSKHNVPLYHWHTVCLTVGRAFQAVIITVPTCRTAHRHWKGGLKLQLPFNSTEACFLFYYVYSSSFHCHFASFTGFTASCTPPSGTEKNEIGRAHV